MGENYTYIPIITCTDEGEVHNFDVCLMNDEEPSFMGCCRKCGMTLSFPVRLIEEVFDGV